jgi:hypothetical protein
MPLDAPESPVAKTMRQITVIAIASMVASLPLLAGESSLVATSAAVGNQLEASAFVTLSEPTAAKGLEVTLRSSDPTRLLLAKAADQPGAASLLLRLGPDFRRTPEFWLQALDSSGSVTYIAEAPGYTKGVGTVTLFPSGIALVGPFKAPRFLATTGGEPTKLTLY